MRNLLQSRLQIERADDYPLQVLGPNNSFPSSFRALRAGGNFQASRTSRD
jgi:hypothetical protein